MTTRIIVSNSVPLGMLVVLRSLTRFARAKTAFEHGIIVGAGEYGPRGLHNIIRQLFGGSRFIFRFRAVHGANTLESCESEETADRRDGVHRVFCIVHDAQRLRDERRGLREKRTSFSAQKPTERRDNTLHVVWKTCTFGSVVRSRGHGEKSRAQWTIRDRHTRVTLASSLKTCIPNRQRKDIVYIIRMLCEYRCTNRGLGMRTSARQVAGSIPQAVSEIFLSVFHPESRPTEPT